MKNHKINYKKYISLATVLAMTLIGVAISPDLVNNTKYEVTDTNKSTEEQVVNEVNEVANEVVTATNNVWETQFEYFNSANESYAEKGSDYKYTLSTLKSEDGKFEMFMADLDQKRATNSFGTDVPDNTISFHPSIPEDVTEDTVFKYKLSTIAFDAIVGKDINLPTEKYTVKIPDTDTNLYDVQLTADGYLIIDAFNVEGMQGQNPNNFTLPISFESFDMRQGLKFHEPTDEITFEAVEGGLEHSFDPTVGQITQMGPLMGFSVGGGYFPEYQAKHMDYNKIVTKTGEVDWNTPGTYKLTYVLRYESPLPRFDVTDTYTVNVIITPKEVAEDPKPEAPKPEAPEVGVSIPELNAEPIKLPLENRDFKGLEELIYEAYDSKDGNLNSKVKIKSGAVNLAKVGKYTLVLEVTNSDGVTAEEQVVIEVFENEIEPKPETPVVPEDTETEIEDPKGPEPTDTPGVPETPEPEQEPDVEVPETATPDVEKPTLATPDIVVEPEKVEVTNDPKVEPVKEPETAKEQAKKETLEVKKEVTDAPKVDKKAGPDKLLQTDIKGLNIAFKVIVVIGFIASGLYLFKQAYLLFKKSVITLMSLKK